MRLSSKTHRYFERCGVFLKRRAKSLRVELRWPNKPGVLTASAAVALMELAEEFEDDDSSVVLTLTGSDGKFCVGFEDGVNPRFVETLAAITKITIGAINGDAFNEGLELALALDLRVGVKGARFAMTQITSGMIPAFGGTQRLPRIVGQTAALKMILTGDSVEAEDAYRLGLLSALASSHNELSKLTNQLVSTVTSRGPIAVKFAKEAVLKGADMTLGQGIRLEEDLYALLQVTADRAEGVRAFLEKRKPLFKGE